MAEDKGPSLLAQARLRRKVKGPVCSIRSLIAAHPDDGIEELLANTGRDADGELRGEGIPYKDAAETLNDAYNLSMDYQPLSRHIRGECACRR